jgi:hypothetical protein
MRKEDTTVKRLNATLFVSLCCIVVVLGPCDSSRAQEAAPSEAQQRAKALLEEQQKAAAQTAQTYREMDNATLLKKLVEQSTAKREPFNSLAFRELTRRRDVDVASLASLVREMDNANAILPLLLLRRLDEKAYLALPAALRVTVLTDALQRSVMFNTWGLPGIYQEDASRAMLEAGGAAVPALRRMLSDARPAPVFGSQEYMLYKRYQFRLSDYALFFLEKIRGNPNFVMPVSVTQRDALIREMLK